MVIKHPVFFVFLKVYKCVLCGFISLICLVHKLQMKCIFNGDNSHSTSSYYPPG
jgi:formate hydrogenlyase subunit 6/NADH:ubiquinone oxidoreductase subunit I